MKPSGTPKRTPLTRGKPLEARTPLKQGNPLHRGGKLRHRSRKTAKIYVTRRQVVDYVLTTRPWCQIQWDRACWRTSTEVHEPGMRSRGADICDPAQCTATCFYCHRMVHDHPAEATRRGWLIPSGTGRAA